MYENSDSERTATPHPVEFLWTIPIIRQMIDDTNIITLEMCRNLNTEGLNKDNDSTVLFWAPDLECYNESLGEQQIKMERAITKFKKLLEGKEATIEDVSVKDALVIAWARLAKAFVARVKLSEKIKKRALEKPRRGDIRATESLGGRDALEPKYYDCGDFMEYISEMTNIELPRYLR